mgnify:CR=1 FL=1
MKNLDQKREATKHRDKKVENRTWQETETKKSWKKGQKMPETSIHKTETKKYKYEMEGREKKSSRS